MIVESIFSCSNLLLTCGSSIYILVNHSYAQYSKLFTHLTYACVGISLIGTRSLFVLLYKLFFKEYVFDPIAMEIEEEMNRERCNIVDELLGILSMAGLTFSLYCRYEHYVLGGCVIASLSILDAIDIRHPQDNEESHPYDLSSETIIRIGPKHNILNWVILVGTFACLVGNNYALVANYPLLLTNWALTPEGFYQGWTIRRAINDYMMASYIMCMTEALRQVQTV